MGETRREFVLPDDARRVGDRTIVVARPPSDGVGAWICARWHSGVVIALGAVLDGVRERIERESRFFEEAEGVSEERFRGMEAGLSSALHAVQSEVVNAMERLRPVSWYDEDGPYVAEDEWVCVNMDHPEYVRANCTCSKYSEVPVVEIDEECPWHGRNSG
jgi:hypothetical protein